VLERVAASRHRPSLVVTRPDRPRGRGRRVSTPPVAATARRLGIDCAQPESVNSDEALAPIAAAAPEAILICAFGGLIKEPLLSSYELLNVHPSLLPRWRGAAPIERAIEAGDERTGVSIMRPTAELDAGPVCLVRAEPIEPDDDFGSLSVRLERLAGDLLVEALDTRPEFREQPHEGVTFADKITAGDRLLDPDRAAIELERRVRALSPHISAHVELEGGERLQVLRARALQRDEGVELPPGWPLPGELLAGRDRLLLGCADGALELLTVKPAGRGAMDVGAYLRGHRPAGAGQSDTR
jgi:methionyl-tRNA formyltransferase